MGTSTKTIKKEGFPFNIYDEIEPFKGRTFVVDKTITTKFLDYKIDDNDDLHLKFEDKTRFFKSEKEFKTFWESLESPHVVSQKQQLQQKEDAERAVVVNVTLGLKSFSDDAIGRMGDALSKMLEDAANGNVDEKKVKAVTSIVATSTGLINAEVAAAKLLPAKRKG